MEYPKNLRMTRRLFAPSLSLSRYVIRLFLARFALLLILLVIILQLLDMLNQADKIMAADTASRESLLLYIRLRAPELISQFMPFAVLLAALFTLGSLSQSLEVTIMRAAGLSAAQIMSPIIAATLFIAIGHLLFHDWITVESSRTLHGWRANDYRVPLSPILPGKTNILINDGNRVLEIGEATRTNRIVILDDVTIYERAENGDLQTYIKADYAQRSDGGDWMLVGVRRFSLDRHELTATAQERWHADFPLQPVFARLDRPDHARIGTLIGSINTLHASGMETFSLASSLYHRFAIAASSMIMPLIASFVAFGSPRGGARVGRIVVGMAVGFSFFVMDNYMAAMGTMGVMPPFFAAFSPLLAYLAAGLAVLNQTE